MHPSFRKLIFLWILLLGFAAAICSEVPKAPFSLSVVPTYQSTEVGGIEMAQSEARDFYVVLTNISRDPQPVWMVWYSWGYQNISFELTTSDGRKFVVSKGEQSFSKNHPSTNLVPPGEHQVYAIRLDKEWEPHPALPKSDEMPIALKAIYEVSPTPEAAQHNVWTGRVESHTYKFSLRRW